MTATDTPGNTEERPTRRSWRSWIGVAGTVVLVLGLTGLLVAAQSWKRELRVRSVIVVGLNIVPPAEIATLTGISRGQKLFGVDLGTVRRNVEQHPFVRSASVERDAPDRIIITIDEREPVAAIMADRMMYLDSEATVLPAVRSDQVFDLPVITGSFPLGAPGKRINAAAVHEALDLLVTARRCGEETYRRISEIHVQDQREMLVYTAEYGIPIIMGRGDVAEKLLKLDAFWDQVIGSRGPQGLQYVDLRFQDQVVVRWTGGHGRTGD